MPTNAPLDSRTACVADKAGCELEVGDATNTTGGEGCATGLRFGMLLIVTDATDIHFLFWFIAT